jgi:hypothetical protein
MSGHRPHHGLPIWPDTDRILRIGHAPMGFARHTAGRRARLVGRLHELQSTDDARGTSDQPSNSWHKWCHGDDSGEILFTGVSQSCR